jgi:acetyl esterase
MALDQANLAYLERVRGNGIPPARDIGLPEYRQRMAAMQAARPRGPEVLSVEDHLVFCDAGGVPVRLYVPVAKPKALMVYMHGGGWATGSVAGWDPVIRALANATGCAVVSVDYRLAPEHPFPAAVDDVMAVLGWAAGQAESIAGVPVPLVVAGDSAGANLAAAATLLARDAGGPAIGLQVLAYPSVDGNIDAASLGDLTPPSLSRADIAWYYDRYVPDPALRRDPRFSPIDAPDHCGLPRALILTAENDILRGQAEDYGTKLVAAGVPVTLRRYLGTMHGFLNAGAAIPQSGLAIREIAAWIDYALGIAGDPA